MKRNTIKVIGLLLLATLLCVAVFATTSCGDKNKVSEIYIQKSDLPRTDYVEGQDLDLSKGKLTVVTDGEESILPLTAPEVTVTGYDKDVIGKQTITVTYMEQTTTFTVNVIERAVAENYETKYFVGSEFDSSKGKIRITTDDAKSFFVNMNDAKVSLVSFDSEKAGTTTVTVVYNDGINAYYCQFDVTVYEQSNIEFTAPKNNAYQSHYDGKPDVSGGFFHVTSSDGTLEMNVPVTQSMIKGFDLSVATIANRTEPFEQQLTVEYLGREFYYNIYITFSGISAINHYAGGDLASIDWTKVESEKLTEAQKTAAIAAITEYYALTDDERALLSDDVKALVGRAGALAVNEAFSTELAEYANTFELRADGKIYFNNKSTFEAYLEDTTRLNDTEEKVNVYADLLRQIVAEFGELAITEEKLVKNIVLVYSESMETQIKETLNHLVDVFKLVKDVPEEWTKETLVPYGDNLLSAAMQIYAAGYYKNGATTYYTNILSPWREKNDVFDILYTYFLYDYEDGHNFMINYMWASMPMPGLLQDWYTGLSTCMSYSSLYKAYASQGVYLVDTTSYMSTYFLTLEICEEIKNSGNQFWIDIYNVYSGDNMNHVYMYAYSYGYLYYTKAMIDSDNYHTLWKNYYTLLKLYNAQKLNAETHKNELLALYQSFENLSPDELLGFLSSISLMYTSGNGKYPMLGYTSSTEEGEQELVYNLFSLLLSNYYASYMTEGNQLLFNELLSAMESFILVGYKEGALNEFNTKMAALKAKIDLLEGDEKANFEEYFDDLYNNYLAIYKVTSKEATADFTEAEAKLVDEFMDVSKKFITVYSSIYNLIQQGYTVSADAYPIMYALYARASELRDTILASANEATILAMYTKEYEVGTLKYTPEQIYYLIDTLTVSVLAGQSAIVKVDGKNQYQTYWDLYVNFNLETILSDMADVLYSAYFTDGKAIDHATLVAFMKQMREFNTMNTSIFNLLSIDSTFYRALVNFYKSTPEGSETTVLTEAGIAVSEKLVALAKAYTAYSLSATTENRTALLIAMVAVEEDYAALSDADKAYLSDMYDYYAARVAEVKNSTEQEAA